MKTKELIRRLKLADPSGEDEVVVEGTDIYYVHGLPGYYDGPYEQLIRDGQGGYDIVGARVRRTGQKVVIKTLSVSDAIFENPELPVDTSELSGGRRKDFEKWIENERKIYREMEERSRAQTKKEMENEFRKYSDSKDLKKLEPYFLCRIEEGREEAINFLCSKLEFVGDLTLDEWISENSYSSYITRTDNCMLKYIKERNALTKKVLISHAKDSKKAKGMIKKLLKDGRVIENEEKYLRVIENE